MNPVFRAFLTVVALVQGLVGLAFAFQWPLATALWPFSYTANMTYILIGSMFLAACASTLWCLWTREDGALAGVALDYLFIFVPSAVFALQIADGSARLLTFAALNSIGILMGLVLLLRTARIPINPKPALPRPVRYAFIVFVVALLIVGGSLVLMVPNVLPWSVNGAGSVLYGWMFLGAAAFFAYTLLRPSWHNAGAQLAGFLAYDIVLLPPFLQRLGTIEPQYLVPQLLYLLVVVSSALISVYYLFIHPETRIVRPRAFARQPVTPAR